MTVIERELSTIRPYENNPRLNDAAVEYVANSIKSFGWKQPIVVDRDGVIVAGHTRYKAAQRLGMKTAPVVVADDLTPEQIKAYRLADNKVAELAEWDFSALEEELAEIDLDMTDFGFEELEEGADFFAREQRDGAKREEGNDAYNNFLDKFDPKKTTDDCYTPDNVYEAVADFVAAEYGKNKSDFVRPFYPGGDYQNYKYQAPAVVVDNPPFSILAEIVRFYTERGISFFLFAPTLTIFSTSTAAICSLCTGVTVTYENGANVNTSFLTNLEKGLRIRSAPKLYAAVDKANEANLRAIHADLPKYSYPNYVITSTRVSQFSKYGIDFDVPVDHSAHIRQLDAQKKSGNAIYGSAYLLSEEMKAEREKAEREKAERWELSAREMEIVRSLGGQRNEA